MRTPAVTLENGKTAKVIFPTADDIRSLRVGDLAPDLSGQMKKVTEILGYSMDFWGRNEQVNYRLEGDTDPRVCLYLTENEIFPCGFIDADEINEAECVLREKFGIRLT